MEKDEVLDYLNELLESINENLLKMDINSAIKLANQGIVAIKAERGND